MATKLVHIDEELRRAAEKALVDLVRVEHEFDRSSIILPVWMSSGSAVVVSIMRDESGFLVSDLGEAYQEAEDVGAQQSYAKQAKKFAEELGLNYADKSICLRHVAAANLAGAISLVAEAAKSAYDASSARTFEARDRKLGEVFYDKLVRIFDPKDVAKDVSIRGASNHEWHFSNVVTLHDQKTIFEPVSTAPNSIFSVFSKFQDVKLLERPPARVSVVQDTKEMGDYLSLLAQTSSVIESEATDFTVRQLVA